MENLTVFFSSWFAMVGNLFQMCIHRTIGGFMNVVCVLFFLFQLTYFLFVNCFSLYSGMVSVHVVVFVPFTDHIG